MATPSLTEADKRRVPTGMSDLIFFEVSALVVPLKSAVSVSVRGESVLGICRDDSWRSTLPSASIETKKRVVLVVLIVGFSGTGLLVGFSVTTAAGFLVSGFLGSVLVKSGFSGAGFVGVGSSIGGSTGASSALVIAGISGSKGTSVLLRGNSFPDIKSIAPVFSKTIPIFLRLKKNSTSTSSINAIQKRQPRDADFCLRFAAMKS